MAAVTLVLMRDFIKFNSKAKNQTESDYIINRETFSITSLAVPHFSCGTAFSQMKTSQN